MKTPLTPRKLAADEEPATPVRPAAAAWAQFLPLRQACEEAHLSRSEVYRRAAKGELRLLKLGKAIRVDMRSVASMYDCLPPATIRLNSNTTRKK
jgi:hypothetical protein